MPQSEDVRGQLDGARKELHPVDKDLENLTKELSNNRAHGGKVRLRARPAAASKESSQGPHPPPPTISRGLCRALLIRPADPVTRAVVFACRQLKRTEAKEAEILADLAKDSEAEVPALRLKLWKLLQK